MKDSEFIELLNLYLDHEISAADAARLEAEVQGNANRRRVYQDYCRMQKACKILAQDFSDETAPADDRKVVAFQQARGSNRRGVSLYVASGLAAAAACVAVVFIGRTNHDAGPAAPAPLAVSAPAAVPVQAVAASNAAAAQPARGIQRQALNPLSLRNSENNALALATNVQNDPHFAWMQQVKLAPLSTPMPGDQVRLDLDPQKKSENRTFSSGNRPLPSDLQWTAVRFLK